MNNSEKYILVLYKSLLTLRDVRDQIERIMASAKPVGAEYVEEYIIKTGALHRLVGMVRGGTVIDAMDAINSLGIVE